MVNQQQTSIEPLLQQGAVLIAQGGWQAFTLDVLARELNMAPAALYEQISSKEAFLERFVDHVTAQAIGNHDFEGLDEPRDRFFEVVMQRLDVLAPYKGMVRALSYELPCDPLNALGPLARLGKGIEWIFSAVGFPLNGLKGIVKLKAFGVFYGLIVHQWLSDETPEQAATLRALDENLDRFMPVFLL
ncbi:TetR/AcrR family transcriptional regulator [Alphaproteobacteria bacterium]|nr:TetR/AcrR family transcriptional regulator [Alphaproteobacteria bacterium]